MSERRGRAHWVQNINHNPTIKFSVSNKTYEGNARVVDPTREAELAARISELMDTKYKWNLGLIVEIIPLNSS